MICYGKRSVCLANRGPVYQYIRLITCYRCVLSLVLVELPKFIWKLGTRECSLCVLASAFNGPQSKGWLARRADGKGWEGAMPVHGLCHYGDVIMGAIASQITSLTIVVYSTVYSDAERRKHQSSASLLFVRGTHRGPVYSPYKWPVTRKMFPFDDVIMARRALRIYLTIQTSLRIMDGRQATRHALWRQSWMGDAGERAPEASEQGYTVQVTP